MGRVETGLDLLVSDQFSSLKNKRVAILANHASVDRNLDNVVHLAIKYGVNVVKIFAPEHGFLGAFQDMEHVDDERINRLNIPVISLYGDHKESLKLTAKQLDGVDILLADLQDIGSRYYTFHCTIAWAMAACCERKLPLVVVDRPNPIGAQVFEGNLVREANFSFVGAYPLLNRHGFTMGELVYYVRDMLNVDLNIDVLWMRNYDRNVYFEATSLPFVSPSPNMPTINTAVVYPGMCLIEGTNMSEGRGTCTPFELVGAPYIKDPESFKARIDAFSCEGVTTRACEFKPKFHKHADKICGGVFVHVTDRKSFRPVRFAVALIHAAMSHKGFDWRREAYEFETSRLAIDLLLGDSRLKNSLEIGDVKEVFSVFADEEKRFSDVRKKYLRY